MKYRYLIFFLLLMVLLTPNISDTNNYEKNDETVSMPKIKNEPFSVSSSYATQLEESFFTAASGSVSGTWDTVNTYNLSRTIFWFDEYGTDSANDDAEDWQFVLTWSDSNTLSWQRGDNDCTVYVNVHIVEFHEDAGVTVTEYSGYDTAQDVTLSPTVNPANTFVINSGSYSTTTYYQSRCWAYAYLVDYDTVTVDQSTDYDEFTGLAFQVVSIDGASVQRGDVGMSSSTMNVAIGPVDTSRSFVSLGVVSENAAGYAGWDDSSATAELTSSTNLEISTYATNADQHVYYEVIEMPSWCTVYQYEDTNSWNLLEKETTITAVDLTRSISMFQTSSGNIRTGCESRQTSDNPYVVFMNLSLTDSTTVTTQRGGTGATTEQYHIAILEFDEIISGTTSDLIYVASITDNVSDYINLDAGALLNVSLKYESDDSAVTTGTFSLRYGTTYLSLTHTSGGYWTTTDTSSSVLSRTYNHVNGSDGTYAVNATQSQSTTVTWERVSVTLSLATASRIPLGYSHSITVTAIYESDSSSFDGSTTITGGDTTPTSAVDANNTYGVTSISGGSRGISGYINNTIWAIWSDIEITSRNYYWTQNPFDTVYLAWETSTIRWTYDDVDVATSFGVKYQSYINGTANDYATVYNGQAGDLLIGPFTTAWYNVNVTMMFYFVDSVQSYNFTDESVVLDVNFQHSISMSSFHVRDLGTKLEIGVFTVWHNATWTIWDNSSLVAYNEDEGIYYLTKSSVYGLHNLTLLVNATDIGGNQAEQTKDFSSSDYWLWINVKYWIVYGDQVEPTVLSIDENDDNIQFVIYTGAVDAVYTIWDNSTKVAFVAQEGGYTLTKSTTLGLHNLTILVNGTTDAITGEQTKDFSKSSYWFWLNTQYWVGDQGQGDPLYYTIAYCLPELAEYEIGFSWFNYYDENYPDKGSNLYIVVFGGLDHITDELSISGHEVVGYYRYLEGRYVFVAPVLPATIHNLDAITITYNGRTVQSASALRMEVADWFDYSGYSEPRIPYTTGNCFQSPTATLTLYLQNGYFLSNTEMIWDFQYYDGTWHDYNFQDTDFIASLSNINYETQDFSLIDYSHFSLMYFEITTDGQNNGWAVGNLIPDDLYPHEGWKIYMKLFDFDYDVIDQDTEIRLGIKWGYIPQVTADVMYLGGMFWLEKANYTTAFVDMFSNDIYTITIPQNIEVQAISFFGVGSDFSTMTYSFSINKICTYTIQEESENNPLATTHSGSVDVGENNIAWTKLSTIDDIVNFTITFTNGTDTYVVEGQYQAADSDTGATVYYTCLMDFAYDEFTVFENDVGDSSLHIIVWGDDIRENIPAKTLMIKETTGNQEITFSGSLEIVYGTWVHAYAIERNLFQSIFKGGWLGYTIEVYWNDRICTESNGQSMVTHFDTNTIQYGVQGYFPRTGTYLTSVDSIFALSLTLHYEEPSADTLWYNMTYKNDLLSDQLYNCSTINSFSNLEVMSILVEVDGKLSETTIGTLYYSSTLKRWTLKVVFNNIDDDFWTSGHTLTYQMDWAVAMHYDNTDGMSKTQSRYSLVSLYTTTTYYVPSEILISDDFALVQDTGLSYSGTINVAANVTIYENSIAVATATISTAGSFSIWWDRAIGSGNITATLYFYNSDDTLNITVIYEKFSEVLSISERTVTISKNLVTFSAESNKDSVSYSIYLDESLTNSGTVNEGSFALDWTRTASTSPSDISYAIKFTDGTTTIWINNTYQEYSLTGFAIDTLMIDTSGDYVSVFADTSWDNATVYLYQNDVLKTSGSEGTTITYEKSTDIGTYNVSIKIDTISVSRWINTSYTVSETAFEIESLITDVSGNYVSAFVITSWDNATVYLYQNDVLKTSGSEGTTLSFAKSSTAGYYNVSIKIDTTAVVRWWNFSYTVTVEEATSFSLSTWDIDWQDYYVYVTLATSWGNSTVSVYEDGTLYGSSNENNTIQYLKSTTEGNHTLHFKIDGGSGNILWKNYSYSIIVTFTITIYSITESTTKVLVSGGSTKAANYSVYVNDVLQGSGTIGATEFSITVTKSLTAAGDFDWYILLNASGNTFPLNGTYTVPKSDVFGIEDFSYDSGDVYINIYCKTTWQNATLYIYDNGVYKAYASEADIINYRKSITEGQHVLRILIDAGSASETRNITYTIAVIVEAMKIVVFDWDTGSPDSVSGIFQTNWNNATITITQSGNVVVTGTEIGDGSGVTFRFSKTKTEGVIHICTVTITSGSTTLTYTLGYTYREPDEDSGIPITDIIDIAKNETESAVKEALKGTVVVPPAVAFGVLGLMVIFIAVIIGQIMWQFVIKERKKKKEELSKFAGFM